MVCTKKWYIIKIMYITAKFLMSVALVTLLHLGIKVTSSLWQIQKHTAVRSKLLFAIVDIPHHQQIEESDK